MKREEKYHLITTVQDPTAVSASITCNLFDTEYLNLVLGKSKCF